MAIIYSFVPLDLHGVNPNTERPVDAIYSNGRRCRFPSIRDAGRMMCIPSSNIVACLKGRIKTAGGCQWEYVNDEKGEWISIEDLD